MATQSPKAFDPESIFRQAVGLSYSSRLLTGHVQLRQNHRKPKPEYIALDCPTLVSSVILSAFSLELYLKCLCAILVIPLPQRTHSLNDFFNVLPSEVQAELMNGFDQAMGSFTNPPLNDLGGVPYPEGHFTFQNCLDGMSEAFVEWRYLHEESDYKKEYNGDTALIAAIEGKIISIKPNWQVIVSRSLPNVESIIEPNPHA